MEDLKGKVCCASVWGGWSSHHCGKPAKIEHKGGYYCGIHDPIRKETERIERDKKYDERWKRIQESDKRNTLIHEYFNGISTEEIQKLVDEKTKK